MEAKLGQFKDEETVVKEVVFPKVHVTIHDSAKILNLNIAGIMSY